MLIRKYPALLKFFDQVLSNHDLQDDQATVSFYRETTAPDQIESIQFDLKKFSSLEILPLEELGSEANRWFATQEEARDWLDELQKGFSNLATESGELADPSHGKVEDSNGTALADGDTVQVIKDLKVKGGSSDLKRGTIIRKIRLIADSKAIECKVDGSTLVLKTEFLKKS